MKTLSVTTIAALALAIPTASLANDFGTDGATCNHATLGAALSAVSSGGTIYVKSGTHNIAAWGTNTISDDVTLQGSDGSCSSGGTSSATLSYSGGSLRFFEVDAYVHLILNRITLSGGSTSLSGPTVYLNHDATLAMIDSVLKDGVSGGSGGCLYVNRGTVSMIGSSAIRDCEATNDGGGVDLGLDASLYMYSPSIIEDNVAVLGDGGNIYNNGGYLFITGIVRDGEATNGDGGGIAIIEDSGYEPTLVVSGGEITNNTAGGDGGGIFADVQYSGGSDGDGLGPEITLKSDAEVDFNDATGNGGGLWSGGVYTIVTVEDDAIVKYNDATSGGGAWIDEADVFLSDSAEFLWNDATNHGGGLYLVDSTLTIDGSSSDPVSFYGNASDGSAGGLYVLRSDIEGDWAELQQNNTAGDGGAVRLLSGSTFDVTNTLTHGNWAANGGGYDVGGGSTLDLSADFGTCSASVGDYCSTISLNSATNGGGVYVDGGSTARIQFTHLVDNWATGGGGALYSTGSSSTARVRNSLVEHNWIANVYTTAIEAAGGTLDVRSGTLVDNWDPLTFGATVTGTMHRNVVAFNQNDAVLTGTVNGHCNATQTVGGLPTGANNVASTPSLDANWVPTSLDTVAVDACASGPGKDITGAARYLGARFDRGAFEAF